MVGWGHWRGAVIKHFLPYIYKSHVRQTDQATNAMYMLVVTQ